MFSIDSYIASIKSELEKYTNTLIEELQKITSYKFDANVDILDFSAFIEPTRFELSIMMFSMDKNANEVFGENITPNNFTGSVELLPDVSYFLLQDNQRDSFWSFYEQNVEELVIKNSKFSRSGLLNVGIKRVGKFLKYLHTLVSMMKHFHMT